MPVRTKLCPARSHIVMVVQVAFDYTHLVRLPPGTRYPTLGVKRSVCQNVYVALGESHCFLKLDVTALRQPNAHEVRVGRRITTDRMTRCRDERVVDHLYTEERIDGWERLLSAR